MQFIFQDATASGPDGIEPGLLLLKPLARADRDRRDLALYALEYGAERFLTGTGPIEKIALPLQPTLDDALAAQIVERNLRGDSLPDGLRAFAQYAKTVRQGLPAGSVSPDASLEGIYWAMRSLAGDDLSTAERAARFSTDCCRLMERIVQSAKAGLDPHSDRLFDDAEFSLERGLLADDKKVYRQDVARGRSWVVHIPDGPPEASALVLDKPKSMLFKHWSRGDEEAPVGDGYTLIVSGEGDGQWVMTTPRSSRLSLKQLADALQKAESEQDAGFAEADPWYDGRAFDHTLVGAPRGGTRLSDAQVLQVIQRWAKARRNTLPLPMKAILAGASVIIVAIVVGLFVARFSGTNPTENADATKSKREAIATVAPASGDAVTTRGRPLPYLRDGTVEKGIQLYALNIGISDYEDDSYDLTFADDDAEAFRSTLQAQEGRPFEKVILHTLTNQEATRSNIISEFAWLKKQATQHDLVIVTVSGHGMREEDDFFLIPHDYKTDKEARDTAVSWGDFAYYLERLPCAAVLVMDTCHSGAITMDAQTRGESEQRALNRAVENFGRVKHGVVIIAASMSGQLAQERSEWGHGVLTLALLEGIEGRYLYEKSQATQLPRLSDDDQILSLKELEFYASRRVKELVGGKQAVIGKNPGDVNLDDIPLSVYQPASDEP